MMLMDTSLVGKTALVCGSSQGIGKAIAVALASMGASCILVSRNASGLQATLSDLNTRSGQLHAYRVVDFNDTAALSAMVKDTVASTPIDILINNTGGPAAGDIAAADPHQFEQAFSQHLVCNHILAQAVLPSMKAKGWGRIINIISTSVRIPLDHLGVSNTIRAAVASWAKTLSNEVAQFGITVNSLLPGFIATSRLDAVAASFADRQGISKPEMEQRMRESVPAKRFGDPAEIASVAAFLASPAASYVNGVSIPVDGGRTGPI
jgi:3-oxoacyl-[acyl-carrier protein] reductase